MNCIQTSATDYDQMFWPQVVRGRGDVLHSASDAPRAWASRESRYSGCERTVQHDAKPRRRDRHPPVDTVIYSRAPIHAGKLRDRLVAGDLDVLKTLGVTPDMIGPSLLAPKTQAILAPLIEKVAFVEAINDAWAVMALVTLAVMMPCRTPERRSGA
jgi:DHA2 family multidrug resistance protein